MLSHVIIQDHIQHLSAVADHWHWLLLFLVLGFKYYMSLTCSYGRHGCWSLCANLCYVPMHRDERSECPEPAWSSAAALSTPLKKTLPDALTMLRDSERKYQASQKEEQERCWRSSWWWGGYSKGRLMSLESIKRLSWFSLPSENEPLIFRIWSKENCVESVSSDEKHESWLTAVKTRMTTDKRAHSDAVRGGFLPDLSLLKKKLHNPTGIPHSHISNTK